MLNIFVKNLLDQMGMREIGRNSKFYDPREMFKQEVKVGNQTLFIWKGFKTSIKIKDSIPYLMVDHSTRVLRAQSALDYIYDLRQDGYINRDIEQAFMERSVMANYGNNRIWRVDAVRFDMTPMSTFKDDKDNEQVFLE